VSVRELVVLGTASQVPTRHRNHNGYLLRWDGEGILFDPGEGTQRQMLRAGVAAHDLNRICVTHFHGDHSLGLAGIIQRINLDKVPHQVTAHYPRSGQRFFDRLRYATAYRETVPLTEAPVDSEGDLAVTPAYTLEARELSHAVETYGYRIVEPDGRRMLPERLAALGELAEARPDLDILTTDAFLELEGEVLRRVYGPDWPFEVADQRRGILERNFVFGHAAVRRETLLAAGGFDESIRFTTDWECWIRLILSGSRAGAVLEPLSRYRVREQSLSADRPRMTAGRIQSLRKGLEHPSLGPEERAVARSTIAAYERELSLHRLREALRQDESGARRIALGVSLGRKTPLPTRFKGLAAVVAPRVVGRVLRSREEPAWVGAGATTVERAEPPSAAEAARRS
jgi:hypothetical protein